MRPAAPIDADARRPSFRSWVGRRTSALSRRDWVYLLSLLLPLAIFNVALKVIRINAQLHPPGPIGFLEQVRSDLFFNLAFTGFWIAIAVLAHRRGARVIARIGMHLAVIIFAFVSAAAHLFYLKTGSPLDPKVIEMAFVSFDEFRAVIGSELSASQLILVGTVLGYGLFGPMLITRLLLRAERHRAGSSGNKRFRTAATVTVGSVLAVLISTMPATSAASYFSRDPVVNMIASQLAQPPAEAPVNVQAPEAADLPASARLASTGSTEKRNVVMVFLESIRADATTVYNPELPTTPFLDELAKTSLVADNAYAVVTHTSKSLVAGNCGIEPPLDMKNSEAEPGAIPSQCLPELLGEQGYRSAFFQSATSGFERRAGTVENLGYDEFYGLESLPKAGFDKVNYFGYEDDIMLEPSRSWVEQDQSKPFLATYLTVSSHHDYAMPPSWEMKDYSDNELLNKYYNTVNYGDQFVQHLFQQYKEMGLYDDTIFVIMADHGEGFGEHGLKQHDNTIYNEGVKIPMIIHDPQRFKSGERVERPVQHTSIVPTVADLLGYKITDGKYRGESLLNESSDPIITRCFVESRCLSLIDGDEKYIYHFGSRPEEYFDLMSDPYEQHNLIGRQDKEKIASLRSQVLYWQAEVDAIYAAHDRSEPDSLSRRHGR